MSIDQRGGQCKGVKSPPQHCGQKDKGLILLKGRQVTTKQIEDKGIEAFRKYLLENCKISEANIIDIRNKGRQQGEKKLGCDIIVKHGSQNYYFEIKASLKTCSNMRFTHQTISTMRNKSLLSDMRVVFVYNLRNGIEKADFLFFRFGDIPENKILVEPRFIVKPKSLPEEITSVEDPFLDKGGTENNMQSILSKPVRDFMNL